jgi:hypothetical protein
MLIVMFIVGRDTAWRRRPRGGMSMTSCGGRSMGRGDGRLRAQVKRPGSCRLISSSLTPEKSKQE